VKTNSTSIKTPTALRVLAFFELALIAVTWRLWSDAGDLPRVPLLSVEISSIVFCTASIILVAGCVLMLLGVGLRSFPAKERDVETSGNRDQQKPLGGYIAWIAGCVCVLANQRCLQAWHWLFLLSLGLWLFTNRVHWPQLMHHVLCTIYVCSALSRITPQPESGMTAVIARQLMDWAGTSIPGQELLLPILCHGLTAGELLIGILLLFRRTRALGVILAELLHATLFVALGPFGLNHHPGVLVWNVCLMILIPAVFLWDFVPRRFHSLATSTGNKSERSIAIIGPRAPAIILVSLIWAWPVSGLFGVADNWPSWQLYSSRPEVLTLTIDSKDVSSLPASLQPFVESDGVFSSMSVVRLDRWSLAQTGSPIYPEDRLQLAIIAWCVEQLPEPTEFEARISEPDPIFWWRRRERTLKTREELNAERKRHWLPSQVDIP
jgi:hypothetical protein